MNWAEQGGAAFPIPHSNEPGAYEAETGMSLREYAAITLRVPNSGTDWLDDMIRESRRMDFAGQALAGEYTKWDNPNSVAFFVNEVADAMLAERAKPLPPLHVKTGYFRFANEAKP
jgi:hypothetical protein